MQLPPIEKMDASLSTLAACEWEPGNTCMHHTFPICVSPYRKLSLSSNCIDKITNLNGMSKTNNSAQQSFITQTFRGTQDSVSRTEPDKKLDWTCKCTSWIKFSVFHLEMYVGCSSRHTGTAVDILQQHREVKRHRSAQEAQGVAHLGRAGVDCLHASVWDSSVSVQAMLFNFSIVCQR